jgi:hypothetical protein
VGVPKVDKKILILVIIFGLGLWMFIQNNIFLSLYKKNKGLAQELRKVRKESETIDAIFGDSRTLATIQKGIENLDGFLSLKIPEKISIPALNEMLTEPLKEQGIIMKTMSVSPPESTPLKIPSLDAPVSYTSIMVNMRLALTMERFIQYLAWLKTQPPYVSLERAIFEPQGTTLPEIVAKFDLRFYSLSQKAIPYIDITQEVPFDTAYLGAILGLPRITGEDVSGYQPRKIFVPLRQEAGSYPVGDLRLGGIVIKKSGSSVVIINGQLLKVGGTIEGYKVISIEDQKVTLERGGELFDLER